MMRWLRVAALLLPVIVLALLIGWRETELRGAQEWRIPVRGVDPLDLLRGRYVTVQLDWALEGPLESCDTEAGCSLCLEQRAAIVVARVQRQGESCPALLETGRSRLEFWPARPTAAPEAGTNEAGATPQPAPRPRAPAHFETVVFVPEARADSIDSDLREGLPTVLVARLTRGGRLVADRLEPDQRD